MEGYPDQAIEQVESTIKLARSVNHPFTLSMALNIGCWAAQVCRDAPRLHLWASECEQLCTDQSIAMWKELSTVGRCCADVLSAVRDDRTEDFERCRSTLKESGYQVGWGYNSAFLAVAHLNAGNLQRCAELFGEGDQFTETYPDTVDEHNGIPPPQTETPKLQWSVAP